MSQPNNYSPNLPRVSTIVEWKYPFAWYARNRFLEWLKANSITLDDYMEEASSWGTFVHKSLEDYLNWIPFKGKKYKKIVKSWIEFIKDTGIIPIWMEEYISTKDYQWTVDLIAEYNWEKWILDWKTYWLAKYRWWLNSKYKKPYDKLKKARLQLSLYAYALWIKNIAVIELDEDTYHFHPLELIPIEELEEVIREFKYNYVDNL